MFGGASNPLTLARVSPTLLSAAQRAAEAARRVPSPEPQPRREKRKKVSWPGDDGDLVAVRFFRKVSR